MPHLCCNRKETVLSVHGNLRQQYASKEGTYTIISFGSQFKCGGALDVVDSEVIELVVVKKGFLVSVEAVEVS